MHSNYSGWIQLAILEWWGHPPILHPTSASQRPHCKWIIAVLGREFISDWWSIENLVWVNFLINGMLRLLYEAREVYCASCDSPSACLCLIAVNLVGWMDVLPECTGIRDLRLVKTMRRFVKNGADYRAEWRPSIQEYCGQKIGWTCFHEWRGQIAVFNSSQQPPVWWVHGS